MDGQKIIRLMETLKMFDDLIYRPDMLFAVGWVDEKVDEAKEDDF